MAFGHQAGLFSWSGKSQELETFSLGRPLNAAAISERWSPFALQTSSLPLSWSITVERLDAHSVRPGRACADSALHFSVERGKGTVTGFITVVRLPPLSKDLQHRPLTDEEHVGYRRVGLK